MTYVVAQKIATIVKEEMAIYFKASHEFDYKAEAMEWMFERGMQREFKVVPTALTMPFYI